MMAALRKRIAVGVLAAIFLTCGGMFCLTQARAETKALSVESFMLTGASVRLDETHTGMRFTSALSKAEYKALTEQYDITAGMLIIPQDELEGELNLENETDEIMNIVTKTYVSTDSEGNPVKEESADTYQFRAVISGIPEEAYGSEILGKGYITLSNKETAEETTLYTETLSRNVAYVSYKAKMNESDLTEEQKNVLDGFIGEKVFSAVNAEGGVLTDYDFAYAGQTVKFGVPEECFAAVVTGEKGNVKTQENTFVMPDYAVTVKGVSAEIQPIQVNLDAGRSAENGGTPTGDVTSAVTVSEGVLSDYEATYRSSAESVATVAENGVVSAVGAGKAEIFVKLGKTAEQKIADISVTAWTELTKENFINCMTYVTAENGWCVVGNYYLSGDIDLEGQGANFGAPFNGILDGNGYAVKNATFTGSAYGHQANGAFFGDILEGASVKNIAFVNFNHPNTNQAGGFFNSNHGTIENVYVKRIGNPDSYGGLIGGKLPYWNGSAWEDLYPTTGNYGTVKNVVIDTSGADNGPAGLIALTNWESGVIENIYAVKDKYWNSDIGGDSDSPLYFVNGSGEEFQYGTSENVNAYDDMNAIVAAMPEGLLKTMVTRLTSD